MRGLYTFNLWLYLLAIRAASLFNTKAKLWLRGRKGWKHYLQSRLKEDKPTLWFHCASLGEFEQGRPLMERMRRDYPAYRILLTFFSPSGYEVRKNYAGADVVCYLPLDTPSNARAFMDIVKPKAAFFVKYEFWFNTLRELEKRGVPHYLISAIFRADQHFFKSWGGWFRKALQGYDFIFTQDEESLRLLRNIGIKQAEAAGDTRFDRVAEIAKQAKDISLAATFAGEEKNIVVAGSTWPSDEEYLFPALRGVLSDSWKLIIAPHELGEAHLAAIEKGLQEQAGITSEKIVRYSLATEDTVGKMRVLVIDNIGMLSSLYRYGRVAYVGGGFGKAVHNTLEAAIWNMPVICGPAHAKFKEIGGLILCGGAFAVSSGEQLKSFLGNFLSGDSKVIDNAGFEAGKFTLDQTGATEKIMRVIGGSIVKHP